MAGKSSVAVVGTGIAGNLVSYLLHRGHDITVFEASDWVGGHSHTVEVERPSGVYAVDTGFIVFNHWTYPRFIELLDKLEVASKPTAMSFGVRDEQFGLEYSATSLNTLFAQRRNLLRPSFHEMLVDAVRFNRGAPEFLATGDREMTLREYMDRGRYGHEFRERFIVPMGSAIWSSDPDDLLEYPAFFFLQFFRNHGFLNILDQPQWRVVEGGSWSYVRALTRGFRDDIRLETPVERVTRHEDHVLVTPRGGEPERFDEVVFATHSDQALRILGDASADERAVLGAIGYQKNDVVLHTDTAMLPKSKLAWAAWNAFVPKRGRGHATVTYNMNLLQGLDAPETFCITLNQQAEIDPSKVLRRFEYEHPLYTSGAVEAQGRWGEISGVNRTHFCGAYWGCGFHEDGVKSALRVGKSFGVEL